jgi:hypothetical protein
MVSRAKNVQPMEEIKEYDGPTILKVNADYTLTHFPELP